jgi:AraC family transcriptional regulator
MRPRMETCTEERQPASMIALGRSHDWVRHVISLLDTALHHLDSEEKGAVGTILKATSLLRQQIDPSAVRIAPDERGHMLAWQVRKVRDYIDRHIASPVLVADLCAVVKRSEAYFSRSFKRTFGKSPHAFLVRRRLELAAQYMLTTDASLSDIALRCGFADQPHLCKHFRQAAGQTPAAWRRAQQHDEHETPLVERFSTASRNGRRVAQLIDRATQVLPGTATRAGLDRTRTISSVSAPSTREVERAPGFQNAGVLPKC